MDHTADWWLGDLTHPWFLELERAIHDEWGREPMRVREGGVRSPSHSYLSSTSFDLSLRAVHTMRTFPRKSVRLPCSSPPDGTKLGTCLFKCAWP